MNEAFFPLPSPLSQALLGATLSSLVAGCGPAAPPPTRVASSPAASAPAAPSPAAPADPAAPGARLERLASAWRLPCAASSTTTSPTNFCTVRDQAATPDGGTVLSGDLWGKVDIGPHTLASNDMSAALLVKLDAKGTVVWARAFGRAWHNQFDHVEVAADGSIWTAGIAANGFHPSLPRRPDPSGAGDDERPIVAKLTPEGKIAWVKDWLGGPTDLLATDRGVLLASRKGRVVRFPLGSGKPETVLDLRDRGEARPEDESIESGQFRLDPAGLWVLQGIKRSAAWEARISRYAWGAAEPLTVTLGETTLATAMAWRMVPHAGDLYVAGTESRPSERPTRWVRVSSRGDVVWRRETSLGRQSSTSYSLEMSHMAVQNGRVLTLFTYGEGASLFGIELEPAGQLSGAARGAAVLALDADDGRATEVYAVSDACAAASVGGAPAEYFGFGAVSGRLLMPSGSSACADSPGAAYAFDWSAP